MGVVPNLATKGAAQGEGVGLLDDWSASQALNTFNNFTGVMFEAKGLLSFIRSVFFCKGDFWLSDERA